MFAWMITNLLSTFCFTRVMCVCVYSFRSGHVCRVYLHMAAHACVGSRSPSSVFPQIYLFVEMGFLTELEDH